jgi:hypothetical protein
MNAADKAGALYLALVTAYERCGILQRQHAPDLLVNLGEVDYEVRRETKVTCSLPDCVSRPY